MYSPQSDGAGGLAPKGTQAPGLPPPGSPATSDSFSFILADEEIRGKGQVSRFSDAFSVPRVLVHLLPWVVRQEGAGCGRGGFWKCVLSPGRATCPKEPK